MAGSYRTQLLAGRRRTIAAILATLLLPVGVLRAKAEDRSASSKPPIAFPPFELQADRKALAALLDGIAGYKVESLAGRPTGIWLEDKRGGVWLVGVAQRDLRFKFEVFALGVMTIEQLRERWRNWKVPKVAADMPEPFRSLMAMRPPEPAAPDKFDDWQMVNERVEVLRRDEFIVEGGDAGPTVGDNPSAQSAARPGQVPKDASAYCTVAVGLLFSGQGGERMLVAADWSPFDLIVTRDAGAIEAFAIDCERVELSDYIAALDRK